MVFFNNERILLLTPFLAEVCKIETFEWYKNLVASLQINICEPQISMGDFIRFGYDIMDDGGDFGGDNLDEMRAAAKWETVSRNATVFIIDVTDKSIFHSFQGWLNN